MKKILFCLCIITLLLPQKANAGGMFLTNGSTQIAPSSFRAAIVFDGTKQTLFDSVTFNLNPLVVWNVLWIIPVPSKPEVEIVEDDLLNRLDALSEKTLKGKTGIPKESFSRPVNLTRFEIFAPNGSDEFRKMVNQAGFLIPKSAENLISGYLAKNWYLVTVYIDAVHLQTNATDSLTSFGGHTFPIKISFKTDKIIYPLKFASVPQDIDSEAVPLSYNYGTRSENILGEKDERVDQLLSEKSKNKYPSLPLDLSNLKIDLFIFDKNKTEIDGFTRAYTSRVSYKDYHFKDPKDKAYFKLPEKNMILSRVYNFIPQSQAEDLTVKKTPGKLESLIKFIFRRA